LRHVVPESIEAGRLLRTSRAPHGIDVVQAVAIDAPAPVASTAEQLQLVFGVLDDHEFAGTAAGTAARHRVHVPFTPAGVEQLPKRLHDHLRHAESNRRLGPSRSARSGLSVAIALTSVRLLIVRR